MGKLKGVIIAKTPSGSLITNSSISLAISV
jgi:hypothetical protein